MNDILTSTNDEVDAGATTVPSCTHRCAARLAPTPTRRAPADNMFLLAAALLAAETQDNASVSDGSNSDDTASDGGSSIGSGVEAGTGDTPFPPRSAASLAAALPSARAFHSVGSGRR